MKLNATKMTLWFTGAALALLTVIAGCDKPQPAPAIRFEDADHTFVISYPRNWQIEQKAPLILLTGDGTGTRIPSKLMVVRQPAPWGLGWALSSKNMDDIQGGFLRGLAGAQVEAAHVENASAAYLGGEPARRLLVTGHSARFDADVKMLVLFCVHGGATYFISGSASPERFQRLQDETAAAADTFRLLH